MKYTIAATSLALASVVGAYGNGTHYVTEIVTALTTYCPEATLLTQAGTTYTITEATTLTITNCPCTLTHWSSPTPAAALIVSPTPTPSTLTYTTCSTNTPLPPNSNAQSPTTLTQTDEYGSIYTQITTPTCAACGHASASSGGLPPVSAFTGAAETNGIKRGGMMVAAAAAAAAAGLVALAL